MIIPEDRKSHLFSFINSINRNIQFTEEVEENQQLAFLDMKLMKKENGRIDFTVYRKPSNTGKYLDYKSYNSKNQKISVINSLVTRAFKICSPEYLEEELEIIRKDLM